MLAANIHLDERQMESQVYHLFMFREIFEMMRIVDLSSERKGASNA